MRSYGKMLAVVMIAFSVTAPVMAQGISWGLYMTADHNMRSSKLLGTPVYNQQGEKIGTIDDILLPAAGGEVTAVISVGDFVGTGSKMVKIPLSHVQLTGTKPMMTGDGGKAAVMAMPSYSYGALANPG